MKVRLTIVTALALGLALTTASPATPNKGPAAVEANRALTQRVDTNLPPQSCQSKWCKRVRATVKIAKRIDRALTRYGSPMAGLQNALEITRAVRAENRSPFAMLGISGAESSFAKESCGYNTTGLGSCWAAGNWKTITLCGRTFYGPTYVTSWARGLGLTARLIRCLLPDARTVYQLSGYCVNCPTWAGNVAAIMRQWFQSGPGVMWRDAVAAVE